MIPSLLDRIDRSAGVRRLAACLAFAVAAIASHPAKGIVITWTDMATSGFSPAETAVVTAAIDSWEALITDFGPLSGFGTAFSVTITETPTAGLGAASAFMSGAGGLPVSGVISIDDGTFAGPFGGFFVDPTPGTSSEFVASSSAHYGTAIPGGSADGKKDLLTVVVHELGHVLGFEDSYVPWATRIFTPLTLTYDIIPPTATAALSDADHLAHDLVAQPFDLMATAGSLPTLGIGDRRLPSGLDADTLEGVYFYTVDRSALGTVGGPASVVPEPSMSSVVCAGIGVLIGLRLARRRRASGNEN